MDKIFVGYPYSELLYNNTKKTTIDTNNMSESQSNTEWKKSHRVYAPNSAYIKLKKVKTNLQWQETDQSLPREEVGSVEG